MHSFNTTKFLIWLACIWGPYFLYLYLFWFDVPGKPRGTRRFTLLMNKFKRKTVVLCSKHLTAYSRPGKLSLVDNKKCTVCKK